MPPKKRICVFTKTCINPFKIKKHKPSSIYTVTENLLLKFPTIPEGSKICISCRIKLMNTTKIQPANSNNDGGSTSFSSNVLPLNMEQPNEEEPDFFVPDDAEDAEVEYECDENDKDFVIRSEETNVIDECNNDFHKWGAEVLTQIIKKFKTSTDNDEKFLLLSLAPQSWSQNMLSKVFGISERQSRNVKRVVHEHGILSFPNTKKGKSLPCETETLVKNFYECDGNSRMLPGIKDFVSVKQADGTRLHVQKRLLLCNINELYELFLSQHEDVKISISKFTKLRPRHCVLAGSSGTHNVCVCVHHENVKLMLNAIDIEHLTQNTDLILKNYHDCLNTIVCPESSSACFLGDCENCPGIANSKNTLKNILDEKNIINVTVEMWLQTDRCNLKTLVMDTDEFVDDLGERMLKLKTHHFVANEQSSFFQNLKKNLQSGEFLVSFDFAENYAFVIQNAAQSFHWNNDQATIFTVVVYYRECGVQKHKSIAIISDRLSHDTVAVYEYQKLIIDYLKSNFVIQKSFYFSDGAGQHFKNKCSFSNLQAHKKDFGIPAEWHFHATSHGKGACDGIGANIKRQAARHSLQTSSQHHILTPEDLYMWAKNNCKETKIIFSSKSNQDATAEFLKSRFDAALTIPGTLQYHAFIPAEDGKLYLKKVSSSAKYIVFGKCGEKINSCTQSKKRNVQKRKIQPTSTQSLERNK